MPQGTAGFPCQTSDSLDLLGATSHRLDRLERALPHRTHLAGSILAVPPAKPSLAVLGNKVCSPNTVVCLGTSGFVAGLAKHGGAKHHKGR